MGWYLKYLVGNISVRQPLSFFISRQLCYVIVLVLFPAWFLVPFMWEDFSVWGDIPRYLWKQNLMLKTITWITCLNIWRYRCGHCVATLHDCLLSLNLFTWAALFQVLQSYIQSQSCLLRGLTSTSVMYVET